MKRIVPFLFMCGGCVPDYQSQMIVVTPYANGESTVDLHARLGTIKGTTRAAIEEILAKYHLQPNSITVKP